MTKRTVNSAVLIAMLALAAAVLLPAIAPAAALPATGRKRVNAALRQAAEEIARTRRGDELRKGELPPQAISFLLRFDRRSGRGKPRAEVLEVLRDFCENRRGGRELAVEPVQTLLYAQTLLEAYQQTGDTCFALGARSILDGISLDRPFAREVEAAFGLAISSLARGYRVLGSRSYYAAAKAAADKEVAARGGRAEPHFISALIELNQADFDDRWLARALELQKQQWRSREAVGTERSRQSARSDGATILNLLRLAELALDKQLLASAQRLADDWQAHAVRSPLEAAAVLMALDFLGDRPKEIAIVGPQDSKDAKRFLAGFNAAFQPNAVLLRGGGAAFDDMSAPLIMRGKRMIGGKTTFYVCENGSCKMPTSDWREALKKARTFVAIAQP